MSHPQIGRNPTIPTSARSPRRCHERYFYELAEIISSGREMSREERAELLARHDQYMVET